MLGCVFKVVLKKDTGELEYSNSPVSFCNLIKVFTEKNISTINNVKIRYTYIIYMKGWWLYEMSILQRKNETGIYSWR